MSKDLVCIDPEEEAEFIQKDLKTRFNVDISTNDIKLVIFSQCNFLESKGIMTSVVPEEKVPE